MLLPEDTPVLKHTGSIGSVDEKRDYERSDPTKSEVASVSTDETDVKVIEKAEDVALEVTIVPLT